MEIKLEQCENCEMFFDPETTEMQVTEDDVYLCPGCFSLCIEEE